MVGYSTFATSPPRFCLVPEGQPPIGVGLMDWSELANFLVYQVSPLLDLFERRSSPP